MRLETTRLALRDWELKDVDDLVEGINNIEVSKWLAFVPHPYTLADANYWIHYCQQQADSGQQRVAYHLAIELKSEHKIIGGVSLDKVDPQQGTGGGGIWLNANYQGQGYGSEAFGKRLAFAFEELQLRRLENGYFPGNDSSFKLQVKFGYKVEGLRRKAFVSKATGVIMDEYVMGLLREEWMRQL
jgi:RimJ/RimL family protein N-acetyltransferase